MSPSESSLGHDCRLVPAAVAAWAGMWLASSGQPWLLVLGGAAAVAAGLLAWRTRSVRTGLAACVLAGSVIAGGARSYALTSGPTAQLGSQRAVATLVGTVSGEPRRVDPRGGRPAAVLVPVRLDRLTARERSWSVREPVLVTVSGSAAQSWEPPPGAQVRFSGRLSGAEPADGVAARVAALGPPQIERSPPWWLRAVAQVRAGLRAAMVGSAPEQSGLVPALTVGDTSGVSAETTHQFKATGLTHLMAVSGANLTLLLGFVTVVAGWVRILGRARMVVSVVSVLAFVLLCRAEPSVLRAAAMGAVALASLGRGPRAGGGLRNLSLAVIGLVWVDPWLSRSWGFALSVTACLGILVWSRRWVASVSRWLPGWVAEAVCIPLAAQLATQPLVTALSGTVSLAGLGANLLAGPFVGPVTVLGLVTAALGWLSPALARPVAWLAGWAAEPILQVARHGSELPGAVTRWPSDVLGLTVLLVCCLGLAWAATWLLSRPQVVVPVAVLLVAALCRPPLQPGWPPEGWMVMACDVGQGDATLVRAGPGQAVLVDTGPDPSAIAACLDQAQVSVLPLLVLSHYHADHVAGLGRVLQSRPVGQLLVPPLSSPARTAAWVRQLAEQHQVQVRVARPGEVLQVGSLRWETLGAENPTGADPPTSGESASAESSVENDSSIVGRASTGQVSVLLTGDLEPTGQRALLARGVDLRATVLKVPHHGSGRQEPRFLAATGARMALVEVGRHNDYGHPAAKTLRTLSEHGMLVLRTDQSGAVALRVDGDRLRATTQR
ncbi:MAG: ComEC/Rec2 family competence protein [Actinomycetia bacterium]|nr:ComEC/Rec2 family competence protein [Actinomycetes bacterium]